MNIDENIQRIRQFAKDNRLPKSRLAVMAGIQDTVLRKFHNDNWNPTAETLRKLEAVVNSVGNELQQTSEIPGAEAQNHSSSPQTRSASPLER